MRLAVLTTVGTVVVEFSEDVFRKMLVSYTKKHNGDVEKALDQIEFELKQLTITH